MKSNLKKRILAFMLCMVMVLSSAVSVLAQDANAETNGQVEIGQEGQNEPAVISEEAAPEQSTPEAPTGTETVPEDANSVPEKEQPEQPAEETPQPVTEQPQEQQPQEQEAEPFQEAMELKHEIKDADGQLICTITASIPEDTFKANTSEVSMEIAGIDAGTSEAIKGLMKKELAEDKELGEYFLYHINFKVNGETVEPGREIQITFNQNHFKIGDTKKATVFYYNAAHSVEGNQEAEIREIIQRPELTEALQSSGQSLDNIEDYDITDISLHADGTAKQIQTEGRRSTIYGCYIAEDKPIEEEKPVEETKPVEEEKPAEEKKPAKVFNFENDDVTITVSADKEGIIPENVTLQVIPILPNENETKNQYKEVEDQLKKKAENEEYDIAGFLAYDISFINEDGEEVEPSGEVTVVIDYKKEVLPDGVEEDENLDVTVMHLEENSKGDVKEVVDMVADETKEAAVEATENTKIKKAEFKTDSFSAFTITWIRLSLVPSTADINIFYGYMQGNNFVEFDKNQLPENIRELDNLPIYNSNPVDLNDYIANNITGYEFDNKILKDSPKGDVVRYLKRDEKWLKSSTDGKDYNSWIKLQTLGSKGNIYYIYTPKSDGGGTGGNTPQRELGVPDHHKTIKRNGTEADGVDNYTISLDVIGKQLEPDPIDIILIIDKSGSMLDNERYKNVNIAIGELIKTLKSNQTNLPDVNLAVTTFSSAVKGNNYKKNVKGSGKNKYYDPDNEADAWIAESWTSLNNFQFSLSNDDDDKNYCTGGTNWQAGIRMGEKLLQQRSANESKKYVIFLTDGNPTFRYYGNSSTQTQGEGDNDTDSLNYNAAVSEWGKSANLKSATTYVINAYKESGKCQDLVNAMKKVGTSAVRKDGSSKKNLEGAFNDIAEGIVKPSYSNVVIEDKLSQYVQFASETPEIRVYKKTGNRQETLLSSSLYRVDRTKLNQGIVSVSLLNGQDLEDDTTYRVEFEVIPSQLAITGPYNDIHYNGVGTAGEGESTDHPSNNPAFSEGEAGYWSNDNQNTFLSYYENGMEKDPSAYQKPVFQVQTTKYSVQKIWQDVEESVLENLSIDVKLTAKAKISNGKIVDLGETGYLDHLTVTLEDDYWTHTWNNLPKYYYYYENGRAKHVEIQYSADEVTVPDGFEQVSVKNKSIADPDDPTKTITQTLITNRAVTNTLIILKKDKDGKVLEGAEFVLHKENAGADWRDIQGETNQDGKVVFENLENGTYKVTETKAPEGYKLETANDANIFTITLPYEKANPEDTSIEVTENSKVTIGAVDYYREITKTILNEKKSWEIIKKSSSEGGGVLLGAEFKLEPSEATGTTYWGKSETDGKIVWYQDDKFEEKLIEDIKSGKYIFSETAAPTGYMLNTKEKWEIEVGRNGYLKAVTGIDDVTVEIEEDTNGDIVKCYFYNDPLYNLPSAGGSGIYWYLIGGMLLMIAAALILYKNRYREVLKR